MFVISYKTLASFRFICFQKFVTETQIVNKQKDGKINKKRTQQMKKIIIHKINVQWIRLHTYCICCQTRCLFIV